MGAPCKPARPDIDICLLRRWRTVFLRALESRGRAGLAASQLYDIQPPLRKAEWAPIVEGELSAGVIEVFETRRALPARRRSAIVTKCYRLAARP